MNHYVSVCTEKTPRAPFAHKEELSLVMSCISKEEYASETKEDSLLFFNGYPETDEIFRRREANLDHIDTVLLDCDNDLANKNIIDDFKKDMEEYFYYLYETFSSSEGRPKFRAIIPLDEKIKWNDTTKEAIFDVFSDYADRKCSWFFAPTKNRLHTFECHEGKLFPARQIMRMSQRIMTRKVLDFSNSMSNMNKVFSSSESKHYNVSTNDKVRHYLDTPYSKMTGNGDSDNSLYRAICVCLSANDENTLEDVLNKARLERWSNNELNRKIEQARRFIRK